MMMLVRIKRDGLDMKVILEIINIVIRIIIGRSFIED